MIHAMIENEVAKAERLSRARALLFVLMAAAFVASSLIGLWATHSTQQLVAWAGLAILVSANLTPWATRLRPRAVSQLMDDETTRHHRIRSFATGFWGAIATGLVMAVMVQYVPVMPGDVARLIVTMALSAALVSFAVLELNAAQ